MPIRIKIEKLFLERYGLLRILQYEKDISQKFIFQIIMAVGDISQASNNLLKYKIYTLIQVRLLKLAS